MNSKPPRKLSGDDLASHAAALLSARAMSASELRTRLKRRAEDPAEVEQIVAKLHEYGAIDDSRFASHFAEARAGGGKYGKQRVVADLLGRRVAPETARAAAESAFEGVDEHESVRLWLDRKYRHQNLHHLLKTQGKFASVYRRLRTAGFGASASLNVLKRLAGADLDISDPPEDDDSGSM